MVKKLKSFVGRKRKKAIKAEFIEDTSVPRITNDTIAAHREEVLKGARKYIYPLQHSKHRIVLISTGVFIVALVTFMVYILLALYRFESTSGFVYRVTQVIPFPIARAGSKFVAYENYLFELRHYMHFYEKHQQLSFSSNDGREQLEEYKKRALEQVVNDAYVKQLSAENKVEVTNQELEAEVALVRSQNRLGSNDKVFEDVLKDYWGWSLNDFKRSLKTSMLAQEVVAARDTATNGRAQAAFQELQAGKDFSELAKQVSDDVGTKEAGGEFPVAIDRTNRDVSAKAVEALFQLQTGQYSNVVNTGYALEILKNIETQGDRIRAARMMFSFTDINTYTNNLKDQKRAQLYLRL